MISGKEAWIAKSDKKDVQYSLGGMDWCEMTDKEFYCWSSDRFLNESLNYKFRLKPRTITLNGIEVPAPFEPKEGEKADCYVITLGGERFFWKNDEDYSLVVEALRNVFNP